MEFDSSSTEDKGLALGSKYFFLPIIASIIFITFAASTFFKAITSITLFIRESLLSIFFIYFFKYFIF